MKFSKYLSVSVAALAIAGMFVIACDDEETTTVGGTDSGADTSTPDASKPDTSTPPPQDAGTDAPAEASAPGVTVNLTYAGSKTGNVTVALFDEFPPVPPPVAFGVIPSPTFPAQIKLTPPPGEYRVTAFMDVGGNNVGTPPGPEDPRQQTIGQVTFAGADVSVDIVLTDFDAGAN